MSWSHACYVRVSVCKNASRSKDRCVLSGEILLTRTMLSASYLDLAALRQEAATHLPAPIAGVISDE